MESTSSTSSSTSTTTTTTTAPSNTEPDNTADDPQVAAIKAVWTEFVRVGADRSDPDRVAELSTADVPALADDQFFDPRDAQSFYTQVTIDGETATIEDCSLFSRPLSTFHYIPINGAAKFVDGEWKISDLEVNNIERCIPGDVAAEILGVYEASWDAEQLYSDPPDLDHPLIEETMTGERLERKLEILEWQVDNNAAWRGRPKTTPSFIDFLPGLFIIKDCQIPASEKGYYDLTTNERLPFFDQVGPTQTDLVVLRIKYVDNLWKAEFLGADRDVECSVGEVENAIPLVGPVEEP